MIDKEWNLRLMLCLKAIYQIELDLISESEFKKWTGFLQTDSAMQSSTTQDEFVEWLTEFEQRIGKEIDSLLANRSEMTTILDDLNIDTNTN